MNEIINHIAPVICFLGLIVYLIGSRVDDRAEEIGRLAFFAGLVAVLFGR